MTGTRTILEVQSRMGRFAVSGSLEEPPSEFECGDSVVLRIFELKALGGSFSMWVGLGEYPADLSSMPS